MVTDRIGKCVNVGNCSLADKRTPLTVPAGKDFVCPECGKSLLVATATVEGRRTPLRALGAVAAVLVLGVAGYLVYSKLLGPTPSNAVPPALAQASAPPSTTFTPSTPSSSVSVPATGASAVGIAPVDDNHKSDAQAALLNGRPASAAREADQATANELIKAALAKLSLGQLDEADKDLELARARDPGQPLVYYNIAILRLRQKQPDKALDALEQSFDAGFNNRAEMDADHDLDEIRQASRFQDLMRRAPKPPG